MALATTTINEQFTAATINPGDISHYKITIANTSSVQLTSAKVTVLFPAQITIAATPAISNNCGFSGVTASAGTSTLVLSGGTIPANNGTVDGSCTFQVDVTSIVAGNHIPNIPANTTPDGATAGYTAKENGVDVWNGTSANATLSVNALQNPTGAKSFSPSPAVAGDPTTLTITLTNPNAGATIPLTSVVDTLPGTMVVAATPSAANTCGGAVTATAGANTLTLSGGTIPAGGSCTFSAKVVVPTVTGTSQSFTNTMAAGAIGNSRGLTSPGFNQSLTVNTPIAVTKSFNPTTIPANQPSLMTVTIANNSTANTLPITGMDDAFPAGMTILDTAHGATANPAVVCDGAGAANGTLSDTSNAPLTNGSTSLRLAGAIAGPKSGALGKCVITAYVTSNIDGTSTNTIGADAVTNPAGHHHAAVSANLAVNAQLTVAKTVTIQNVAPGQWTQFAVTISNWSGAPVTNVSFLDVLPLTSGDQMVLEGGGTPTLSAGCSGGTWTGTDATGTTTGLAPADGDAGLMWSGGTVAQGSGSAAGTCTITFKARLPASATLGRTFTNQIPAWDGTHGVGGSGTGPGGNVVNPSASPTPTALNVASVSSVAVTKSFSPTTVAQGGISTLTLKIRNRTLASITAVNLTDTFPLALTLAANPAATNTCGGTLQAYPGGNQVILNGGTVATRPNGSEYTECTITVKVTGTTVGTHTNTVATTDFSSSAGTIPSNVSANLAIGTGLGGSKSFSPTSVTSGGVSRVKITVTNGFNAQLNNVSVNDGDFTTGTTGTLKIANPANATTSCAGSPVMIVNPGQQQAQLQGATLNAGASCDFSFDVATSGAGPWVNAVPSGSITSAEGPASTSAVTASLTAAAASIGINKSFNPVLVTGGVPSTLQIDVINNSGVTVHNAGFTDTFPTGIQVYLVPNASTDCAGGTVSVVAGDNKVSLSGATLAANATCHVYVTTTSVKFLNLTNYIPANAITSTEGYTNSLQTSASLSTLQGLGVMKGFSPAYIGPGVATTLKFKLVSTYDANAVNPVILTGVSFTDTLPAGLVVAGTPNKSTDCTSGTVTANAGSNLVTLSGVSITPGTTCNIQVDVVAAALGAYNNTIPQCGVTSDQGVCNPSAANATLNVVTQPTVVKAFSPASVNAGVYSTLTVTVTNNSTAPLSGLRLSDALPSGMAIYSTPTASTTCSNGIVSAVAGSGTLALSGASLGAGLSCTFQARVVANTPASYTNCINANQVGNDQGTTNPAQDCKILTVLPPSSVTKSFSPASIAANGVSTLTISLANTTASPITLSSAFVDALPGTVLVAATPNKGGTCTQGSITATAGANNISYASGASIPAGGCTITVDVTSATCGSYTNTIAAGQLATSAGANQQAAVATLGVCQPAAPTLSKAFNPSTISVGATSTLTITLGNSNASALTTNAVLTDTLPANVVVAATPNIGGTCSNADVTAVAGAGTITYASGASIPAGGCTITVDVTSNPAGACGTTGGSYTNTLAAGALATTTGGSNPTAASAVLIVQAPQPPTIQEAIAPNTINPGGTARFTYTLGNSNASAISLASVFTDTLPANVFVANPPNIGGTCTTASVTAVAGAATIAYAGGAAIPAGGCTILVDVTSAVPGTYANPIAAGDLATSGSCSNTAGASATLFVNPLQPPSISKVFSPVSIPVSGTSTLSISFANNNAAAATLTADLVDTLPAGVTVASTPNLTVGAGCTAAKVVTPLAGSTSVTYQSGGTIPASGGCTITVDVTSSTTGVYTNTINAGALQTSVGNNAVATSSTLTVSSKVVLAKSFTPSDVSANQVSQLTLTLGNPNTVTATLQAALTDSLPAGVVIANPAGLAGTCTLGSVTASAGASSVTYANGAGVPPGGCTIKVNVTASRDGNYTNTIPAGGLQTDRGNNPDPATAVLRVNSYTPPVIKAPTVSKAFNPATINAGETALLTITLGNTNGFSLSLISAFSDNLPAGVTVATPSGLTTTCPSTATAAAGGGTVGYGAGLTVPPGGCSISVNVTASTAGSYTNIIPNCGLSTSVGCNTSPATDVLTVNPPVTTTPTTKPPVVTPPGSTQDCTKSFADVTTALVVPAQVDPGVVVDVPISFANQGTIAASDVTYAINISGVNGIACSGATCAFNAATGAVTPNGLPTSLAVGQTAGFTLTYTTGASGRVSVSSSIATKTCQGANAASDSSVGSTDVKANTLVTKAPTGTTTTAKVGPTEILCGTSWSNNGNGKAINVRITYPIPTGTTYMPGSALCQVGGASTSTKCSYDAASKTVVFEGKIASDLGMSPATSANPVSITFKSTYLAGASCSDNPARTIWDTNGDGSLTSNIETVASGSGTTPAGSTPGSAGAASSVTSVPALSPAGLALLMLLVGGLGLWQSRRRAS